MCMSGPTPPSKKKFQRSTFKQCRLPFLITCGRLLFRSPNAHQVLIFKRAVVLAWNTKARGSINRLGPSRCTARAGPSAQAGRTKLFLGTGCSVIAISSCFWHLSLVTVDDRILEFVAAWTPGFPMFCIRAGYQAWAFLPSDWVPLLMLEKQVDTPSAIQMTCIVRICHWPLKLPCTIYNLCGCKVHPRVHFKEAKNNISNFKLFLPQVFSQQKEKDCMSFFFFPMPKCSAFRMELQVYHKLLAC